MSPPSLGIRRQFLPPEILHSEERRGKKKKNHAMNDEGCPGTERWDDFVPSKIVSCMGATVRLPRQDAFQNEEVIAAHTELSELSPIFRVAECMTPKR